MSDPHYDQHKRMQDALQARRIAEQLTMRQMADEIEWLRAENKQLGDRWNDISYERNDLKAEIERLTRDRDDALECERQHAERLNRVVDGHIPLAEFQAVQNECERFRAALVRISNLGMGKGIVAAQIAKDALRADGQTT